MDVEAMNWSARVTVSPNTRVALTFMPIVMDDDHETYILLLLSDSNLPTGSFVASAGFESYVTHGFSTKRKEESTTGNFLEDSLKTYAHSALPFVSDAHRVVEKLHNSSREPGILTEGEISELEEKASKDLTAIDDLYEAMTLNHVARRASKAQGVALLTLYSKGFSQPTNVPAERKQVSSRAPHFLDWFKLQIRREEVQGHLPVCWGALTGALGLSLERSQYLHLFLHARSLLSASVRMNEIGPYHAQQLLMHVVGPLIAEDISTAKGLRTGALEEPDGSDLDETVDGPVNTWPLGEIIASRHDLQHSRIFNS